MSDDTAQGRARKQIDDRIRTHSGGGNLLLPQRPDLYDLGLVWSGVLFAVLILGPVALIALLLWALLLALRLSRFYAMLLIGVWVATVTSAILFYRLDPLDGYLDAQTYGVQQIVNAARGDPADPLGYVWAVAPYALSVAVLVALCAYVYPLVRALIAKHFGIGEYEPQSMIVSYGATETRRDAKKDDAVPIVPDFALRKRLTAMPSLPKRGKSKALAGLVRAIHDGNAWFGKPTTKGRVYIVSEEDRNTFAGKLNDFDITSEMLASTHLPEYKGWAGRHKWDALTMGLFNNAKQQKADVFILDTLTSWAPWAFTASEYMSVCLARLKYCANLFDMAVIIVLHDRKSGGEAVLSMLGSITGAAAYDIIAGFDRDRVTGVCTLTVTGRVDEWEANARLDGVQYVPVDEEDKGSEPGEEPEKSKIPVTAVPLLTAVRAAGRPLLQKELAQIVNKQQPQVSRDLKRLIAAGLITYDGQGKANDPYTYRVLQEGETPKPVPGDRPSGPAVASGPAARAVAPRRRTGVQRERGR